MEPYVCHVNHAHHDRDANDHGPVLDIRRAISGGSELQDVLHQQHDLSIHAINGDQFSEVLMF
jgi:hypothetical protein